MSRSSFFPRPPELPRAARLLLDALDASGTIAGSLDDARAALADAGPPSSNAAIRAMLAAAPAASVLELEGEDFRPPGASQDVVDTHEESRRASRIICVDVESAVRARIEDNGAISRDVWEIGAVRFGPDRDWVAEQESMRRFVSMRPGFVGLTGARRMVEDPNPT